MKQKRKKDLDEKVNRLIADVQSLADQYKFGARLAISHRVKFYVQTLDACIDAVEKNRKKLQEK
jgi:hypothetical protein